MDSPMVRLLVGRIRADALVILGHVEQAKNWVLPEHIYLIHPGTLGRQRIPVASGTLEGWLSQGWRIVTRGAYVDFGRRNGRRKGEGDGASTGH